MIVICCAANAIKNPKPYKWATKAIYHPKIFSATLEQTTQGLQTDVEPPNPPHIVIVYRNSTFCQEALP